METGKPNLDAMATKRPDPNSAHTMERMSVPGLSMNGETANTPLRTVLVTPAPKAREPVLFLSAENDADNEDGSWKRG